MRKLVAVVVAAALVGGVAWVALAETGTGVTPVNCMDSVWRTTETSTSSTHFTNVPGLADTPSSIFPISINVSAVVSGAPVRFRILSTNVGEQTHVSKPGPTRFVPSGSTPDSFAYQWIERNQSAAVHGNLLRLQWRSPSGSPVHMIHGDMVVQYSTTKGACIGST
jgi:hypothetical protein